MKKDWPVGTAVCSVILSLVALFLLGCATSYTPSTGGNGFSETQVAPDTFRVIFRGNEFTSGERTQDFALLRASELTLQHGFSQFAVMNENHAPYWPRTGLLIKCVSATPD